MAAPPQPPRVLRQWFCVMKFQDLEALQRRQEWLVLEANGRCWFFRESRSRRVYLEHQGHWMYNLVNWACCPGARLHNLTFLEPLVPDDCWVPGCNWWSSNKLLVELQRSSQYNFFF